jgi:putative transposase
LIRTFRYPLRPTKAQEATLNAWRVKCCELYNAALEQRREAWRKQRVGTNYVKQCAELTELRNADPEWLAIPIWVERSTLSRLQRAFESFFRRVKAGTVPGFPRFRSDERYNSFGLGNVRVGDGVVHVPKLGAVKYHEYRKLRGEVRETRLHRGTHGWSVCVVCDLGRAPTKISVRRAVGIDVGLEAFATLSNGERVENPRYGRNSAAVLAYRQRNLARKRLGSNSRAQAKRLVARAHERIRNRRNNFARKLACVLFSRFDLIAHEDLDISRMVRGNLAKSIHDAAWGQFLGALRDKAESAGRWCVPVDPRGTFQICVACGAVKKKELSQRQHVCPCGFSVHRDVNAAQNILARGLRVGQPTKVSEIQNQSRVELFSSRSHMPSTLTKNGKFFQ